MLEDVPSPIDLRHMSDAMAWEKSAMSKRPWRVEFFEQFAAEITAHPHRVHRVLELGSGPGFLAEHLLSVISGLSYVLLDFSPAMQQLAKLRLDDLAEHAQFIERSFKQDNWPEGLGQFECVVTHQAVHELRHKRYASQLHAQVRSLLTPGSIYLVCDHYFGDSGMKNDQLYMTVTEQKQALIEAGFTSVKQVLLKGGLVLHNAS